MNNEAQRGYPGIVVMQYPYVDEEHDDNDGFSDGTTVVYERVCQCLHFVDEDLD